MISVLVNKKAMIISRQKNFETMPLYNRKNKKTSNTFRHNSKPRIVRYFNLVELKNTFYLIRTFTKCLLCDPVNNNWSHVNVVIDSGAGGNLILKDTF